MIEQILSILVGLVVISVVLYLFYLIGKAGGRLGAHSGGDYVIDGIMFVCFNLYGYNACCNGYCCLLSAW